MAGWKLRKDKAQTETSGTEAAEDTAPVSEFASPPPGAESYALPTVEDDVDAPPVSRWEMPEEDWHAPAETAAPTPVEDEPETPEEVVHPTPHVFDLSGEPLATPEDFALVDGPPVEAHHHEVTTPEEEDEEDLHFAEDAEEDKDDLVLVDYSDPAPLETPAAAIIAPPIITPPPPLEPEAAPDDVVAPEPLSFSPPPPPITPDADGMTSTLRMDRSELAAAFAPPPVAGSIPPVAPFVMDVPPAAAPTEAAHRLTMRLGRLSAAFDLTKDVTTIGRPDSALHYYPDVEIELDDAVSRRHAEVLHRAGAFYVVDTGSTNGTMLNGELLPPHEERELAHGDRIRVGERTELIFE